MRNDADSKERLSELGAKLKAWRKGLGVELRALATELKCSPSTLVKIEAGESGPGRDLAVLIEFKTQGRFPVECWSGDAQIKKAVRANAVRRTHSARLQNSTSLPRQNVTPVVTFAGVGSST